MTQEEVFDKLKSLHLSESTEKEVCELVSRLEIPTTPVIVDNTVVCRARPGNGYNQRSDMLYPPVGSKKYQRASIPGKTAFYGVISNNNSKLENARFISLCECSKLFRAGKNVFGREHITVSYWEIKKPLKLLSFITDKTFQEVNDNCYLSFLREKFAESYGPDDNSIHKKIAYYISNEFQKAVEEDNNYEYMITALIADGVMDSLKFDGILYPSVPAGGQAGINVVLSPRAVNEKLEYIRLIEQILYKQKDYALTRMVKSIERDGQCKYINQFDENFVCQEFGIKNIDQLPWW